MRERWMHTITFLLALLAIGPARAAALDLQPYRGQVVLVDFWASWCTPCRTSFPWLQQIAQRYAGQGLTVITVNVDEERPQAERFLQELSISLPVIYDPQGQIASHYQLQTMPTTIIFDRQGRLHTRHHGFFASRIPAYETTLHRLLAD